MSDDTSIQDAVDSATSGPSVDVSTDLPAPSVSQADAVTTPTPPDVSNPNPVIPPYSGDEQFPDNQDTNFPEAKGSGGLWSAVVQGALAGLAGSAGSTHFGGGAARGAAGALENAQAAALQPSKIQFANAQAAMQVAEAHQADLKLHALPQELQDEQTKRSLGLIDDMQQLGIEPTLVADNHGAGATAGLQQLTDRDGSVGNMAYVNTGTHVLAYDLNQISSTPGGLSLVNKDNAITGAQPLELSDWRQISKPQQAKMISDAINRFNVVPKNSADAQEQIAQWRNYGQTYSNRPDADPQIENQILSKLKSVQAIGDAFDQHEVSQKGAVAAAEGTAKMPSEIALANAKSNIENQANKAKESQGWLPGVTADTQKKALLAENIAENANTMGQIVARRPDLFGAASGRITTAEQMIGNNDPDIAALGQAAHNIGMANNGVHGSRSHEEVVATENGILNSFKNGPKSVGSALKTLTSSAQTFIDAARTPSFGTHSAQGGAVTFYGNQKGSQ